MRQRLIQIVCAIAPIIAALVMPVPGYAAGGYNDWRFANRVELLEAIDAAYLDAARPHDHDVRPPHG